MAPPPVHLMKPGRWQNWPRVPVLNPCWWLPTLTIHYGHASCSPVNLERKGLGCGWLLQKGTGTIASVGCSAAQAGGGGEPNWLRSVRLFWVCAAVKKNTAPQRGADYI